jgi:predicted transposase YbfD/YdcC
VAGDTITIDTMGCQREIAEKIREKGADYVLSLKENQPETYREVKDYFEYVEEDREEHPSQDVWRSEVEKDHGRIERREVLADEDIDRMGSKGKWKDLKTIIQYRCTRTEGEETTVTTHYYLNSRTLDAEENLNVLRKTVLYLLKKTGVEEKRFGLSRKMLRATLSDDFLYDVLFGKVK